MIDVEQEVDVAALAEDDVLFGSQIPDVGGAGGWAFAVRAASAGAAASALDALTNPRLVMRAICFPPVSGND